LIAEGNKLNDTVAYWYVGAIETLALGKVVMLLELSDPATNLTSGVFNGQEFFALFMFVVNTVALTVPVTITKTTRESNAKHLTNTF
jgi:hypothetical protein